VLKRPTYKLSCLPVNFFTSSSAAVIMEEEEYPLPSQSHFFDIGFMGTGCSSALPIMQCVLSPSPSNPCKVCLDAHNNPQSKNRRNNVSLLIRYCNDEGKAMFAQIDCGKTYRDSVIRFYKKAQVIPDYN
jgi:hypothetical protein